MLRTKTLAKDRIRKADGDSDRVRPQERIVPAFVVSALEIRILRYLLPMVHVYRSPTEKICVQRHEQGREAGFLRSGQYRLGDVVVIIRRQVQLQHKYVSNGSLEPCSFRQLT